MRYFTLLCLSQRFVGIETLKSRVADDQGVVVGKANFLSFSINPAPPGGPGKGGGKGGRGRRGATAAAAAAAPNGGRAAGGSGGGMGSTTPRGRTSGSGSGGAPGSGGGAASAASSVVSGMALRPVVGAATSTSAFAYSVAARQMSLESQASVSLPSIPDLMEVRIELHWLS